MLSVLLVSLSGCSSTTSAASTPSATSAAASPAGSSAQPTAPSAPPALSVIVVQAAEHTADGSDDPPLNSVGTARAKRLAQLLATRPGVAVFVNQYQRSQSTGLPTARQWNVAPSLYDASESAARVVAGVRAQYRSGEVLLVGQHDTVAALTGAWCDCTVDDRSADDLTTVFRIDFDAHTGQPKLTHSSGY